MDINIPSQILAYDSCITDKHKVMLSYRPIAIVRARILKIYSDQGTQKFKAAQPDPVNYFTLFWGKRVVHVPSKLFLFTSLASRCYLDDQIEEENESKI